MLAPRPDVRLHDLPQNAADRALVPSEALLRQDPICVQAVDDGFQPLPGQILRIDSPDNLRFLRDDDVLSALLPVPQHNAVPWSALFEVLSDAPLLILTDRAALLLRVGCEDRQHQLAVCTHRYYFLLSYKDL